MTTYIWYLRHEKHQIYTYIGEVCVSVNPYTNLNIYSDEIINNYKGIELFYFIVLDEELSWDLSPSGAILERLLVHSRN